MEEFQCGLFRMSKDSSTLPAVYEAQELISETLLFAFIGNPKNKSH
jgi:hypothetical protein